MTEWTPQQRRLELHRLLSIHQRVVASQLARQWRCAERTIRRDLQKMRDEERLPIEHDPIDQTWRYADKVAEIPSLLVSTADRRALLFSLQAAAQFEGTPVCNQLRRLYQNLLDTLPPEHATKFQQMMQSIRFTGPQTIGIKSQVWDVLLLCLEAHETMRVTYIDGYHGSTTERDVDPYGLMMRDRRWVLVAYCHLRQHVLTFSLHRITRAECTDQSFRAPPAFMDGYLDDAFEGMQSTGEKRKVRLRISQDAPQFIQDRQWSDKELRTQDQQGNIIVEFQTAALFAVERQVRAEEGWVEMMQPAESRKRLWEAGRAIADAHR